MLYREWGCPIGRLDSGTLDPATQSSNSDIDILFPEWNRKERFAVPDFPNPFPGNVDRKINKEELVQALRVDIAGELEAMFLYDAHAQATDDPLVRKVLMDIRDEEKAHVGELMTLLRYLEPNWSEFLAEGEGEVLEVMEELGITPPKQDTAPGSTVGSLIEK